MEQYIAEKIAGELKIAVTHVVREYWELVVLKGLMDSTAGKSLVFKGGTALRLAYGSPRFSEGLDFSLHRDPLRGKFSTLARSIVAPHRELSVTDLEEKRFTYLAEIKVTQDYLAYPFRIKLEISRRELGTYADELRPLESPAGTVQVMARVATLEQIYRDKLACVASRAKPKDHFDLWYLSQRLKRPYRPPARPGADKREFARDLRRYLPKGYWPAIEKVAP
jgi:predicted nucleotidyltransferase component of viral defense system